MKNTFTSFEQMPTALNANQVAQVLGISRVGAYNLMNSEDFPTLRIGKRMIVSKENFINRINQNSAGNRRL